MGCGRHYNCVLDHLPSTSDYLGPWPVKKPGLFLTTDVTSLTKLLATVLNCVEDCSILIHLVLGYQQDLFGRTKGSIRWKLRLAIILVSWE
jgi:hypothetical protein